MCMYSGWRALHCTVAYGMVHAKLFSLTLKHKHAPDMLQD